MSTQAGVFDKEMLLRPSQGSGGSFNQMSTTPVAASQTINAGDIVALSSGLIQQAIALPGSNNSATLSGGALGTLGIALDGIVTNSAGVDSTSQLLPKTTIPVALFDGNLEFLTRVWNATPSNTPITNLTLLQFYQIGRYRGASANIWWYFISTTTTNGEAQYVDQYGVLPYLSTIAGQGGQQAATDQYPLLWIAMSGAYNQVGT